MADAIRSLQDQQHGNDEREQSHLELTGRAVLAGLVVGTFLCFTNCYFGLQSSWISMSSMQAALVGFGLVKLLPRSSTSSQRSSLRTTAADRYFWSWFGSGTFSPRENVVLQATAVALGSMPLTAGLIGIVPALLQLKPEKDHGADPISLRGTSLLLWSTALAFFGVFFASPLRKRFIVKERLTFPSGTATAHLIGVLHDTKIKDSPAQSSPSPRASSALSTRRTFTAPSEDEEPLLAGAGGSNRHAYSAVGDSERREDWVPPETYRSEDDHVLKGSKGWKTLFYSFAVSLAFTLASALFPVMYAIPVFDVLPPHNLAAKWGWYFTPSLSYVGQGIIMGLHTTASMMAGALFGWAFLSPLAHRSGWTDGPPMDSEAGAKAWILWISLAIMTSESFIGLLVIAFSEVKLNAMRDWLSAAKKRPTPPRLLSDNLDEGEDLKEHDDEEADEPPHRLAPKTFTVVGLIVSSLFAIGTLWALFGRKGIEPYTTLLAIVLSFALSILAVRSLGSTDLNPVAALGKITQLIFALVQPHNIVANMLAGGLSEAAAMQSGELMQDFKAGSLVGASPRSQFYGQILGSFAGIFVSSAAYQLYTDVYTIPSPSFPAPAASVWLNFARLVNNGEVPRNSMPWMAGTALLFALTGIVKSLAQARALARQQKQERQRRRRRWLEEQRRRQQQQAAQGPTAVEEQEEPRQALPSWERYAAYLPSGVAFAVGILNTPNFSIARFIGGLLVSWCASDSSTSSAPSASSSSSSSSFPSRKSVPRILLIVLASGLVLGEGAGSIVNLFAKQLFAVGAVACGGCRGGCGGGC